MTETEAEPLLIGEIFVDFTLTQPGIRNKLRLGGVAHAARGFWALNKSFSAAVILPEYLEGSARKYFQALGCIDFHIIGYVCGAPNVTIILDATEVSDQEYETLLREEKVVVPCQLDLTGTPFRDILIFPGSYDLSSACAALPPTAQLHIDVAYDVSSPKELAEFSQQISTIFISTSSQLFTSLYDGCLSSLVAAFNASNPETLILKENRGGARMMSVTGKVVEPLPAQLGTTINSVGVGDVFAAAYVVHAKNGCVEAAWRATYAASAYSQTTYPDLFKDYVQRDLKLSLDEMQQLGGVFLPWEKRREYSIYLAAPDFSYGDRKAINKAIASLEYHNFVVRRPVFENGELPNGSDLAVLRQTYRADYDLLKQCALLFAVPTGRDPGTLVEIGIAIEANIPVIVYDPDRENANTMVIAGAEYYGIHLDGCLNSVFQVLSKSLAR